MKNLYFIADAHLSFKEDEIEKEKREKLCDFLEYLMTKGEAKELFLVGDMFDFWFEWYHVIPKYWFPIIFRLRKLVESGVIVTFIPGNHDFYPGNFLHREIGLNCPGEGIDFKINNKRFFVTHGDGYAPKDKGYRLLKKIIRNPVSIFLYKTFISPDLGMQIAQLASKSSRKLVNIDKTLWAKEYHHFAKKKFEDGFDYVIIGHLHYPFIKEDHQEGKAFVCCGDWMTQFSYCKYDGKKLTLEYWKKKVEIINNSCY
jgi:UDP-2,3-diacylglucosamine hydrolase